VKARIQDRYRNLPELQGGSRCDCPDSLSGSEFSPVEANPDRLERIFVIALVPVDDENEISKIGYLARALDIHLVRASRFSSAMKIPCFSVDEEKPSGNTQ